MYTVAIKHAGHSCQQRRKLKRKSKKTKRSIESTPKNQSTKNLLLFLASAFMLSASVYAQQSSKQANAMLAKIDRQYFIVNKGQWPSEVLYLTRIGGLDARITKKGVLYNFFQLEEIPNSEKTMHELPDKFEYNLSRHSGKD